jgi:Flp pilus assembly protein TadG
MGQQETSGRQRPRRRFWGNRSGNVALITALLMIPITFALGMAFDFTQAQSRKDKLDGIADVAALGAVTPAEMAVDPNTAATQASSLFAGQAATVGGVLSPTPTSTATDQSGTSATLVTRTVVVNYVAQSQNVFASLLGMPTMTIKGSSTASSSTAPNIDFYLLLDTSPSMEIAATSTGIAQMQAATQQESDIGAPPNGNGCAFGCHQRDPSDLTPQPTVASPTPCNYPHTDPANGNAPTFACLFEQYNGANWQQIQCTTNGAYADGTAFTTSSTFPETGRDNYDLSRCLNVTLRIDLLNKATVQLMKTAGTMETTYKTTYRMALYLTDFNQANSAADTNLYTLLAPNGEPTADLGQAGTAAATIGSLEMYQNNHIVSGDGNGDMDTYLDTDLGLMNTTITAAPGDGAPGDPPQEVLFIVTDGLNDMTPTRTYSPMDWSNTNCAAIKARGIRIAVLYTTYEPLNESWYLTQVVPALAAFSGLPVGLPAGTPVGSDPMALAAQQCATSGLYYQVSTDGDINAAMQALFQKVVATARLTH